MYLIRKDEETGLELPWIDWRLIIPCNPNETQEESAHRSRREDELFPGPLKVQRFPETNHIYLTKYPYDLRDWQVRFTWWVELHAGASMPEDVLLPCNSDDPAECILWNEFLFEYPERQEHWERCNAAARLLGHLPKEVVLDEMEAEREEIASLARAMQEQYHQILQEVFLETEEGFLPPPSLTALRAQEVPTGEAQERLREYDQWLSFVRRQL